MESEANYARGHIEEILLSKEDLEAIIGGFTVEIDGIKIKRSSNIGKIYCPECSHFINEDEIKNDKCPICKRVTLMRMWKKEDE
jgi:Zn finger protein HypA/HybF involved in hydrogenase expression